MKNSTIATVLNIIPGLGYIYLGGEKRIFGLILILSIIASIIASFDPLLYSEEYMNADFRIWDSIALFGIALTISAFMYDGYVSANTHNSTAKKK